MRNGLAKIACIALVTAAGLGLGASIASAQSYSRLSCSALWYERNAIFAQFGYCFQSPAAVATFGRGCFAPFGRLSPVAQAHVNEIMYWERQRGCPGS